MSSGKGGEQHHNVSPLPGVSGAALGYTLPQLLFVLLTALVGVTAVAGPLLFMNHWFAVACMLCWLGNYVFCTSYSAWIAYQSVRAEREGRVFIACSHPLRDDELPTYTVLLPLYREASIVKQQIEVICNLDYPTDLLQVFCVVRPNDIETLEALVECGIQPTLTEQYPELDIYLQKAIACPKTKEREHIRILPLSPALPVGTKPAALNWGLHHATGEYLVIYDAEDQPARDQLRLAAQAYRNAPPDVACIEALLYAENGRETWISALLDLETTVWNRMAVPAYAAWENFTPLFGTSGHFRVESLRRLNGWDYYNVTEDWELSVRLHQAGYQVALLDSITENTVVDALGAFVLQRARWMKGFLQTFFSETRRPLDLLKALGPWRTGAFLLKSGLNVFNSLVGLATRFVPVVWLGLWLFGTDSYRYLGRQSDLPLVFVGLGLLVLSLVIPIIGILRSGRTYLLWVMPLLPLYWILLGFAAWRALYELVVSPFYWAKTHHEPVRKSATAMRSGYPPVVPNERL